MSRNVRIPLLSALAATLLLAPSVGAAFPGENGRIAFQTDRGGEYQIAVVNPDGAAFRALTSGPFSAIAPAWSADGKKIAFVSDRNGVRGLHVLDFVTGATEELYAKEGEWVGDPAWSPDGAKIVFSWMAADSAAKDLVVLDLATEATTNLTATPDSNERYPAWSPDGALLAFATDRDGNWEIYTSQADGTTPVNVTGTPESDEREPDWAPNLSALSFAQAAGEGPSGIVLLPLLPAGDAIPLGPEGLSAVSPVFSPDGTRLAFAGTDGEGNRDIFTMALDGTDVTQVTAAIADDTRPSWQPVAPNLPPTADAGADAVVECTSFDGAVVTLDGSASSDPDSVEGASDIVLYEWFEDFATPDETFLGLGETLEATLPLGEHLVTLQVTDSTGQTATDTVLIVVVDTTPPEIAVSLSPKSIWPPNHQMVKVRARVIATDVCSPVTVLLESVVSSEPDDEKGDGKTTGDIRGADVGTPDFEFYVRAERRGGGIGRFYVATYSATDESGNTAIAHDAVLVPHDQGSGKTKNEKSKKTNTGRGRAQQR